MTACLDQFEYEGQRRHVSRCERKSVRLMGALHTRKIIVGFNAGRRPHHSIF